MQPQLPEDRGWMGDRTRGASIGRPNTMTHNGHGKLYLRRLRMYDGGYDSGGAYWGAPSPSAGHVYRAASSLDHRLASELFVWAHTREEAKQKMRELIPGLEFLR